MKHPELFLVPAFMLADYFLTVIGAKQRDRKYSEHFTTEHYELNPIWQRQIARRKWFNARHVALTLVVTLLLVLVMESSNELEPFARGVFGSLLGAFGLIIGRHLCNLLIFRDINRTANEISGKVTMTHGLALRMSLYQYVAALVPLALIAAFSPTPLVVGALLGVIVLLAAHLGWIAKYARERRRLEEP